MLDEISNWYFLEVLGLDTSKYCIAWRYEEQACHAHLQDPC